VYSRENGTDKLVKRTTNVYSEYLYNNYVKVGFYAFKFRVSLNGNEMEVSPDPNVVRAIDFQFDDIVIKTGLKELLQTVETTFTDQGEITQTTSYAYERLNNQYAVTAVTQQGSDGSILKKAFQYTNDIKTGVSTDVYTAMSGRNIISPVVIETDYKNDQPIQSVRTSYRKWSTNIYAPETIDIKIGDHGYESRVKYLGYDDVRNPSSLLKDDGLKDSYIWGYNNLIGPRPKKVYPVVRIQGPPELSVDPALSSAIQSYAFSGGTLYSEIKTDVTFLNSQLAGLRSNPNYTVTSYTYAPLFGITSATDSNGVTIYYEYDNFGRLTMVRDNKGKYLKGYEYRMAGQ